MADKCNVLRYEGTDNKMLAERYDITDFTVDTVVIVEPSQHAVVYFNGEVGELLGAGKHVLSVSAPTGFWAKVVGFFKREQKTQALACSVFFVNQSVDENIGWGTASRILVKDPVYNELINVGANGIIKVTVTDCAKFVLKVLGRMGEYTLDRLAATVRAEIMTVLKTYLAEIIVTSGVSILEINTKLLSLSDAALVKVNERLCDLGITASHFNIADISADAESNARLLARQNKINARSDYALDSAAALDADYNRAVRMADAKAKERAMQGYTYQEEQYWQTQKAAVERPVVPPVPGYGMPPVSPYGAPASPYGVPPVQGYPYGMPQQPAGGAVCSQCGRPIQPGAAFCSFCGGRAVAVPAQPAAPQQPVHTYAAATSSCPNCGYPLTPRMSVCPNCDYDLATGKKQ